MIPHHARPACAAALGPLILLALAACAPREAATSAANAPAAGATETASPAPTTSTQPSSTAPAFSPPDMEFARGCWVEREGDGGPVSAMLRLLPEADGSGRLVGHLQTFDANGQQVSSALRIELQADGSGLDVTPENPSAWTGDAYWSEARVLEAEPPPYTAVEAPEPGRQVAAFAWDSAAVGWTVISGLPDSLSIYRVEPTYEMGRGLFFGQRDGCD